MRALRHQPIGETNGFYRLAVEHRSDPDMGLLFKFPENRLRKNLVLRAIHNYRAFRPRRRAGYQHRQQHSNRRGHHDPGDPERGQQRVPRKLLLRPVQVWNWLILLAHPERIANEGSKGDLFSIDTRAFDAFLKPDVFAAARQGLDLAFRCRQCRGLDFVRSRPIEPRWVSHFVRPGRGSVFRFPETLRPDAPPAMLELEQDPLALSAWPAGLLCGPGILDFRRRR